MEKVATVSKRSTSSLPDIILDYKEAMTNGDRYYIAARFERDKEQVPKKFVLGDGEIYGGYKNAPLEPMTKYKVYVRAATEVKGVRNKTTIVWATSGKEGLATLVKEFLPRTGSLGNLNNACILGSFIFSESWKMKNENLCSILLFFSIKISKIKRDN